MRFLLIILIAFAMFGVLSVDAYHEEKPSRGSSDPKIAVNGNDAYVVWLESTHPEFSDIYFAKITDGKTVNDPTNITDGTSLYPSPDIHVAGNHIYVLWEDRSSKNGIDEMYFAKGSDDGETISDVVEIGNIPPIIFAPKVSIHDDNQIGIIADITPDKNCVLYFSSNDNGELIFEPANLSPNGTLDDCMIQ